MNKTYIKNIMEAIQYVALAAAAVCGVMFTSLSSAPVQTVLKESGAANLNALTAVVLGGLVGGILSCIALRFIKKHIDR